MAGLMLARLLLLMFMVCSINRTTGSDGVARLNINLMSGEYIITSMYEYA